MKEMQKSPAEDAGVRDIHRSVPPAEDECNTCIRWFPRTLPSVWTDVHGNHRIQVLHPLLECYDVASAQDSNFVGMYARNTYGNVQVQQRMYVVVTLHPLQAKESPAEDATCPPHTSVKHK